MTLFTKPSLITNSTRLNTSNIYTSGALGYNIYSGESYHRSKTSKHKPIHEKKLKPVQIGVSKKVGRIKFTEIGFNDF